MKLKNYTEAPFRRSNIAHFAKIAKKILRNLIIFSGTPASAFMTEKANIFEIAWAFEVVIPNNLGYPMIVVTFQDKISKFNFF
jgi:hypothetical protein